MWKYKTYCKGEYSQTVIVMYTCKDNLTHLLYSGKIKKKQKKKTKTKYCNTTTMIMCKSLLTMKLKEDKRGRKKQGTTK